MHRSTLLQLLFLWAAFVNGSPTTIVFTGKDLDKVVDLLLFFNASSPVSPSWPSPVAWVVFSLPDTGNFVRQAVYTDNTAFFVPNITHTNLITSTNSENCDTGYQCIAVVDSAGAEVITNVTAGTSGKLKCTNMNVNTQDIGVGIADSDGGNLNPLLLWRGVGAKDSVVLEFNPQLQVYASSSYQETEIIDEAIPSALLLSTNLDVGGTLTYLVTWNTTAGTPVITPQSFSNAASASTTAESNSYRTSSNRAGTASPINTIKIN